jgi:Outer membrane protein beta-barrel domain
MTLRHVIRFTAVLFAGAALLTPAPTAAQSLTAGIKGGVNVANVTFNVPDSSFSISPKSRPGLVIGGFLAKDFNETAGIVIEGFFSQKGTSLEISDAGFSVKEELRVNYVEFPFLGSVNLKGSDTVTVRILGGPVFGLKASASAKETVNDVVEPDPEDPDIKGHDIGLALGLSVEVKMFVIDARYTWGFVNLNKTAASDEPEVKNRTFAVMFGVAFGKQ